MKHSCFVATWQSGGLLLTAILRNDAYSYCSVEPRARDTSIAFEGRIR